MAGQGDPLGKLSLMVIVLILFYDTIFGLVKIGTETITSAFQSFIEQINNIIVIWGGTEPVFPNTQELVTDLFSWELFLFTNSMAFALILFIDLIKAAYRR